MPLSDTPERVIPYGLVLLVKFYACPDCGGWYRTESLCPKEISGSERWTVVRPMLDFQASQVTKEGCQGCGGHTALVPAPDSGRAYD